MRLDLDERADPYVLSPALIAVLALFLFLPIGFCLVLLHLDGVPSFEHADWPALLTVTGWFGIYSLAALHWERSWRARCAPMAATIGASLHLHNGPVTGSAVIAAAALGLLATVSVWLECR
jgi:hypothetical protein